MARYIPAQGDYVIATKYSDGDPCDQWAVGFISGIMDQYNPVRYEVVDEDGQTFRRNGFRRVMRIKPEVGSEILKLYSENKLLIESTGGRSIWSIVRAIQRKEIQSNDILNTKPKTA